MKAQVIRQFGDPSVFTLTDLADPIVTPDSVLISVRATSVNPVDIKIRSGLLEAICPPFPAVLHEDVAGVVEAVGSNVKDFHKGDHVYGCAGGVKGMPGGALSHFMLTDSRLLAPMPKGLSFIEAAALPLVSITAYESLIDRAKIQKEQNVLVHAGAGGVGSIGVQLAKAVGARVFTTVSSEEKALIAKKLGADEVIFYRREFVRDYVARLSRFTGGRGFDVVFDTVGGPNLNNSLEAVAPGGTVVSIATRATHDLTLLQSKAATLHAVFMLLPMLQNRGREHHGQILREIGGLVQKGDLRPLLNSHIFGFKEVSDAHKLQESGKAIGKIVIEVD